MRFLVLFVSLWLMAIPARAELCAHRDLIVDTARTLLASRTGLNRFDQRRFGPDAAFLLIDYGDLPDVEAGQLLQDLTTADNFTARSMLTAWRIARNGIDPSLAPADLSPLLDAGGPSLHRAVLLADDGVSYFRAFKEAQMAHPLAARQLGQLLYDQPDDVKLRIARSAEGAGALFQAAQVLAAMSTRDAFDAFVSRHRAPDGNDRFTIRLSASSFPVTVLSRGIGNPSLPGMEANGQPLFVQGESAAALLMGNMAFSGIVMNTTGDVITGMRAAQIWWQRYQSGAFDPVTQPEAAGLAMRDAWLQVLAGPVETQVTIEGSDVTMTHRRQVQDFTQAADFPFPPRSERHFAGTLAQSLDWMAAKAALAPYLRGEVAQAARPLLLSDALDWPAWQHVARMVRDDVFPGGLRGIDPKMLAELFWAKGDFASALNVAGVMPARDAAYLRHDMMNRLDRLCAGAKRLPSVMLRMPVYDFTR